MAAKAESVPNPFYISATTSILERRPRTLKHGDTFGVFDHYGDVSSRGGSPEGVFHKDTRFLSDLRVLVNGQRPLLLSSTVQDNNVLLTADLTNPDLFRAGNSSSRETRSRSFAQSFSGMARATSGSACTTLAPTRTSSSLCSISRRTSPISLSFAAIVGSAGGRSRARAERTASCFCITVSTASSAAPRSNSIRGRRRSIRRAPAFLSNSAPAAALPVHDRWLRGARAEAEAVRQFFTGLRDARRALLASTARAASVETSNDLFNEVLCRAVADLYMLMTDTPRGAIPYAGIPWFSTPFGRDAIITAIEMMWINPAVARGVLRFLAATQAKDIRPEAEAEPGKILHEMRSGEMARLGEVPFAFYYGSVDSTPLFVMLAGLYFERTARFGDHFGAVAEHRGCAALDRRLRRQDGDGFVEYQGGETGLTNQGWKDSADSVFHADGSYAGRPDRALRGAGLRLRREAPGGEDGRRQRPRQTRRASLTARPKISGFDSKRRSGATTSAPTPWRSTAGSALAECARPTRVSCCLPASSRKNEPRRSLSSFWARLLHRLGHQDDRLLRSALQPDVLPQRLGLAARQRPDRPRLRPIWNETPGPAALARVSTALRAIWTCAGPRNCSAGSGAPPAKAQRSIRWPALHRHGPAPRRSRYCKPASASSSISRRSRSVFGDRRCRTFWIGSSFARSTLARAKSTSSSALRVRCVGQCPAPGRERRGDGQAIGGSRPASRTLGMARGPFGESEWAGCLKTLALLAIVLVLGAPLKAAAEQQPQMTGDTRIHDPSVIEINGRFVAVGTGRAGAYARRHPSQGLDGRAQVDGGGPDRRRPAVMESKQRLGFRPLNVWAPSISRRGSTIFLYYCLSSFGHNTSAIGLMTNNVL